MRTDQLFSWNSYIRLFAISSLLWFSFPVLAADKALTSELQPLTQHNECERLLDSDLSGHYIATTTFYSGKEVKELQQLIQLRRLGSTSAYTVNMASMDLHPTGIRELHFVRTGDSWRIGDPGRWDATVNIMTLAHEEDHIIYRFENVSDRYGFLYDAIPSGSNPVDGDILHPNELSMDLISAFRGNVRLTRIMLDRPFEMVVSQALKSILATKLDPDNRDNNFDYLITVQMKSPLLTEEAAHLLGDNTVFPLDAAPGSNANGPFYRFAFPANIYKFLESVGNWTRSWKIAQIDAIPSHMVNANLARAITTHVQVQRTRPDEPAAITHQSETERNAPAPATAATPPPHSESAKNDDAEASQDDLAHLHSLTGESKPESNASRSHVKSARDQHPRDLDESRTPNPEEN